MLYPHSQEPLTQAQFLLPGPEYRGTPFWSWNCDLTEEILARGIEMLKSMGFGGFHMHVRTGMATPYLSEAYLRLVRFCVDKAKKTGMLAWLYDEDRWPSGAAGGMVTQNPAFRARHLLFTRIPYGPADAAGSRSIESSGKTGRTGNGRLIARYDITLDELGDLFTYRRLGSDEAPQSMAPQDMTWYAYLETAAENPWYNNQTYVDTLNPEAIRKFIELTHDKYLKAVGEEFGGVVPAIFTDEPQFTHKTVLDFTRGDNDVIVPWTDDLPESFMAAYGENLQDRLPELFWELPGDRVSTVRYHYHDHIAERFARSFADQCGAWCRENGLMLTGHMMEEPTLLSQTSALGDAMRSFRSFDLPGIDMLCNRHEYTTAKQAQSVANQNGSPGVLSELYGVTNWDFDFRGHKLQGDWQAALGITVRVPHLAWLSMAGEAKRDYPAPIGQQSPWHLQYPLIENHFARVNIAMTRGRPLVRVAVVHPVESYWLRFGSNERTRLAREQMDRNFMDLTEWLLFGLVDFDFLSESLLPGQCPAGSNPLAVGRMKYDTVIVPPALTLRNTTIERLEAFVGQGGRLVFLGEAPALVDAHPDDRARALWSLAKRLPFQQLALLEELEPCRDLDIRGPDGSRPKDLLYRMRQEEDGSRWVFLVNGRDPVQQDMTLPRKMQIFIRGEVATQVWNTQDGSVAPLPAIRQNGWTRLETVWYEHDSLLLRLLPDDGAIQDALVAPAKVVLPFSMVRNQGNVIHSGENRLPFGQWVSVTLDEPNVILLDMPETSLDGGEYAPREEVLRADNRLRAGMSWPQRGAAVAQPWTLQPEKPSHKVSLRFRFRTSVPISGARLALEDAVKAKIRLDGKRVRRGPDGTYVDESIGTVPLPKLKKGWHVLEVELPFGRKTNLEALYLLGDFSARVRGCDVSLGKPVRKLTFGDITNQGLPFYGGNLTYHLDVRAGAAGLLLRIPQYRGALMEVSVDGKQAGRIVYSPYMLELPPLQAGKHRIDVRLFGTRYNTFAQLHNADSSLSWFGPNSWRTLGDAWTYEYRFKPAGILKSPELYEINRK